MKVFTLVEPAAQGQIRARTVRASRPKKRMSPPRPHRHGLTSRPAPTSFSAGHWKFPGHTDVRLRVSAQVFKTLFYGWAVLDKAHLEAYTWRTSRAQIRGRLQVVSACNIGALIIRIWFWGILCYNCNKEPPKKKI